MQFDRIAAAVTLTAALAIGASMLRAEAAVVVPLGAVPVSTTILPLDRGDPALSSIGALKFLGAVQIRSSDPLFGGISGLRSGPGNTMLAVTDTGNWLAFATTENRNRLTGIANAVLVPILGADGKPAPTKAAGDAEALEWDPATGTATIVYEQDHRLVHFAGIDPARPATLGQSPQRTERLTAMTGWTLNGGGEAMAVLPGGTRIVMSESARRDDGAITALVTRDGKTFEIGVEGVDGHSPTDAIALDDHRILVLHRRFTVMMGQGAAVTLVDLAPLFSGTPPATLPAKILAQWQPPVTLDNMEGLAVRKIGGRTFLYVISDNNLNSIQRTILMKFELETP
ncbi:esterase-like activity of phytase family protein [Sandarakinorhabdus glacialis]|nr:esterase-like activity of phytase family protein [Polymorphobacter glacialis]